MDKAKETCIEMLTSRGYTNITSNEVSHMIVCNEDGDQVIVFMEDNAKLNKSMVSKYMTVMNGVGITHCIIVYSDTVASMTTKSIDDTFDFEFEVFSKLELQFNITKHRLQPKSFRSLNLKEAANFRRLYGIKFAVMRTSDPIARYYNYKKGDIVEITDRRDLVHYRIVR
jgi:DNA-directed RNA polymerase subunit H (RpoH/RPB5)